MTAAGARPLCGAHNPQMVLGNGGEQGGAHPLYLPGTHGVQMTHTGTVMGAGEAEVQGTAPAPGVAESGWGSCTKAVRGDSVHHGATRHLTVDSGRLAGTTPSFRWTPLGRMRAHLSMVSW